jgi:hypothetical protein
METRFHQPCGPDNETDTCSKTDDFSESVTTNDELASPEVLALSSEEFSGSAILEKKARSADSMRSVVLEEERKIFAKSTETWTMRSARMVANRSVSSSTDGDCNHSNPQQSPEAENQHQENFYQRINLAESDRIPINHSCSPSPYMFSPAKPPRSTSRLTSGKCVYSPLTLRDFASQRTPTAFANDFTPSLSPELQVCLFLCLATSYHSL